MPETTDIFEVMSTMRAMRRLKPDPVPDELINKILQAAQWAPSGGNTQRWRFLVVKDPEIKKGVQVYYKRLYDETVGPRYVSSAPPPGSDPARYRRQNAAVEYLTDHYHEAPVWIVACLEDGENPGRTAGSSIYPAVQNMLLATRALGLGTTLTTRHTGYGKEVDAIFGLPSGVHSYAILPIGWPMGRFGPLGRGPRAAQGCRLSGPVGQALPGALSLGAITALSGSERDARGSSARSRTKVSGATLRPFP
jgi:nitroreductase